MTEFFSRLLNEKGKVTDDNSVIFESGVVYTETEIGVLKKSLPDDIKGIHMIRKVFEGDLEYHGKSPDPIIEHPVMKKTATTEQLSLF